MRKRDDVIDTLRKRVTSGIHFGTLAIGTRLPSARRLARELHADARVIINAYLRLEREGLVKRTRGSRGFFVAGLPSMSEHSGASAEWMVEMLERALQQGIQVPQLAEHVQRSLETVRLHSVCIECNTDQLEWICGELHEDYGIDSTPVEVAHLTASESRAALQRADLIVTTTAHANEVQRVAREVDRPCVVVTLRNDILSEVERNLCAGPVYFICADVRYATKLEQLYANARGAENLRTVVLGWHDPASIPGGAPVWVLRTAHARHGALPSHVHALPTHRLFSAETTRTLLSFVLRANATAAGAIAAQRSFVTSTDRVA
ncbi:MAG TPA: GntR family transcriptional regulator [Gemmatimonadaceae bacterium]|nr:GntR family transcriptional regulator [Gemmatimonadaceae bacterium]